MDRRSLAGAFKKLTRESKWEQAGAVHLNFLTGHPQGMVKIADDFYFSTVVRRKDASVYLTEEELAASGEARGFGFIFHFDKDGNCINKVRIGKGPQIHPGGIDYDGAYIWVPSAEYRPDSSARIFRLDPRTMEAEEILAADDHIGSVVHAWDRNRIVGMSWSARRFYSWPYEGAGARVPPVLNPSHYVNFQDSIYLGQGEILCSGLTGYKFGDTQFTLGGLELFDMSNWLPVHQIPVEVYSPVTGRVMTNNPFWMEEKDGVIRAWFIPDDNDSTLFVYNIYP